MNYDTYPTIEMTRAELLALEDRSAGLGFDRVPGHRFRCDFNVYSGSPPRWVVGCFYVDKANVEKLDKDSPYPFPNLAFVKTRFERVVFTDGPAPKHTLGELRKLIAWARAVKVKIGL